MNAHRPIRGRWRIHPAVIVVIGLAVVLVLVVAGALWQLRADAIAAQHRALGTLATALADELDRGLQGVVVALESTRDGLRAQAPALPEPTSKMLRERAELLPLVADFWTLDRSGHVTASSSSDAPPSLDSFVPAPSLVPAPNPRRISISKPFRVGSRDQVALLTALTDKHGEIVGWLLAGIPTREWEGAFAVARPAADARLLVLRSDGAPLAGPPSSELQHATERSFVEKVAGVDGFIEVQSLRHFPVRVLVMRDASILLARWHTLAEVVSLGLATTLLVLAGLLLGMLRAERARERSQAQLVQSRKLEALGNLAGGVAHDFNNVLAALLGYAELAQQSAPAGSVLSAQIERIVQAGLRGKAVVARILSFSRGSSPRHDTVFAVQPLARQVIDLLKPTMGHSIRVEMSGDRPLCYTRGDATLGFEAVMNLCTNAIQAMPGGGTLRVDVDELQVAHRELVSHGELSAGAYVRVRVSDTGVGIDRSTMEHLFEPFFTTRGQHGTGLGLSVVRSVIEEVGGAIDVRSEPGRGSCFTLYLRGHEAPVDAPADPDDAPAGNGQVIMVVDDDPALVSLTEELLARLGYEPVGFTQATQALAAVRAEPWRFDAVLSDEIMPELAGTRLAAALRDIRPDLPVILVSGFGGADLQARAKLAGVQRILAKPLAGADLARALAALFTLVTQQQRSEIV